MESLAPEVRVADGAMTRVWAEDAPGTFCVTTRLLQIPQVTDDDDRLFLPAITSPLKQEIMGKTSEMLDTPLNEQKDVAAAIRLGPAIRKLAASRQLIKVSASDILRLLRSEVVEELPTPSEMGHSKAFRCH